MMLNKKIPDGAMGYRMRIDSQGLGLRKSYDYVLSPSVLNIEKTVLKIF